MTQIVPKLTAHHSLDKPAIHSTPLESVLYSRIPDSSGQCLSIHSYAQFFSQFAANFDTKKKSIGIF